MSGSRSRFFCTASQGVETGHKRLYLYSKEGCHLCDGLKEKIQALLSRAQYMQTPLTGVTFKVRDITSKPEWWDAYSLTIPVLTVAREDGSREVKVPRPSPRLSADRLEAHIAKSLTQPEDAERLEEQQI